MSRLCCTRFYSILALALAAALPLGALAPGCTSTDTSTVGQRITCIDNGAGPTNCQPAGNSAGSGNTCDDIDEDGDGEPHDDGEDAEDGLEDETVADRDDDGVTDIDDDDDDGDGISDDRDCDRRAGGDDDGIDDSH